MQYGIITLCTVPLRQNSSHKSELVNQLLFGDTYEIINESKEWYQVKTAYDDYEGWLDKKQHTAIKEREYNLYNSEKTGVALDLISSVSNGQLAFPIACGSSLHEYDGLNFKMCNEKFIYHGQALQAEQIGAYNILEKVALRYLQTPYLWGGRSPFGIDCSGFTQIVFKCIGVALKRDAYQQAKQGKTVNFVQESKLGDLAFFHNDDGKIIHVGIVLDDQKIIHASGQVRIDMLDHFGIFNKEINGYSHQLKIIKRITVK